MLYCQTSYKLEFENEICIAVIIDGGEIQYHAQVSKPNKLLVILV